MELNEVKGIGKSIETKLHNLNINTIEELVTYYPYKYNFINIIDINKTNNEEVAYIKATIISIPKVSYIKRNFNTLSFMAISSNITLTATIFNRAFLKPNLILNREVLLVGKYNKLKNTFICNDIIFDTCENRIQPVYHLTEGINNKKINLFINEALNNSKIKDYIPEYISNKYNFLSKEEALKEIHNPTSTKNIKNALVRLKYEELFIYMFKINALKINNESAIGIKRNLDIKDLNAFKSSLEFSLTNDQEKGVMDIFNDLNGEKKMNRLILGDVGSGKTVIASAAIYLNFLSGYQSALMAPTEILAEQHYQKLSKLFSKFNMNVSLLTSSVKNKTQILEDLKCGKIDLIVGTHALISEKVNFYNLGLVITDEQHRFGVDARRMLQKKGNNPDMLYLSATPIPRTYALTIYGDLDLSLIKTKPEGRRKIETIIKKDVEMKDVLYKMLDELKQNHQIYVVAPSIEGTNTLSVFELEKKLNMSFQGKVNIGVIHGKLKSSEKDKIMNDYMNGNIKILISTTVIEVGIDNPNSTMIVIYNAERFGLATLHQLRGRVGRSDLQSYCYLISNEDKERLKVLAESNDGFYITEMDLKLRGHGDFFGVKQSGEIPFKIADLATDYEILMQAKKDSLSYIQDKLYETNEYYSKIIDDFNLIG